MLALIAIGICLWRRKGKNSRGEKAAARQSAAPWTSRDVGSGPEYKRVDTPVGSVNGGRFGGRRMDSSNTFESYRMHDQGSVIESKEALGGYYDHPRSGSRGGYAQSPLGYEQQGRGSSPGGYQQGWAEHHAGDAGAYYEEGNRYGGQSYDDYPPRSYQQQYQQQQQQYPQQYQQQGGQYHDRQSSGGYGRAR